VSGAAVVALEFQRLQPVLFHAGMTWTPGSGEAAQVLMPGGGRLSLRPFCPIATLADHSRRARAAALATQNAATLTGMADERAGLAHFLAVIAPGVAQWDSKGGFAPACPAGALGPEWRSYGAQLPSPAFPSPSLLIFGRFWLLLARPAQGAAPRSFAVSVGNDLLESDGRFRAVRDISLEWARSADRASRPSPRTPARPEAVPGFVEALRELRATGAVSRGDLLLFGGAPPLLGHVLPGAAGRLAIAARLGSPPRTPLSGMCVLRRDGDAARGRWVADTRPVCFGTDPGANEWAAAPSPGVALALLLRYAAVRFAANGRFHEQE